MDDREGSFLSFRPRERAKRVTEWRNLARRVSVNKRLVFSCFYPFKGAAVCRAVFGRARRSRQDPSARSLHSLGRDDKDGFYFQRSFDSLRSLRMTGRDPARHAARDAWKGDERPSSVGCADTFPRGGRQEFGGMVYFLLVSKLVASRRHGRRRALLAALPVAPAAPLSQKSRCAAIFGSPVLSSRASKDL